MPNCVRTKKVCSFRLIYSKLSILACGAFQCPETYHEGYVFFRLTLYSMKSIKSFESCLLPPNFNFVTVKRNSDTQQIVWINHLIGPLLSLRTFAIRENLTPVVFELTEKNIRVEHGKNVNYNFQKGNKISEFWLMRGQKKKPSFEKTQVAVGDRTNM